MIVNYVCIKFSRVRGLFILSFATLVHSLPLYIKYMTTNKQKQEVLINFGLLDPPADGLWGVYSGFALEQYNTLYGDIEKVKFPPNIKQSNNLFLDKIIVWMRIHDCFIARGKDRYNIVYVEGVDHNGNVNNDQQNVWNDRRIVFSIPDLENPILNGNWLATTEPGAYYTYNPMNPQGAFRIKFGQYKAWKVGKHGKSQYTALVQCADVEGYRDKNKDFKRTNDKLVKGLFHINQHHGWDMNLVGMNSAGCLVGQSIEDHKVFMKLCLSDIRYKLNNSYIYYTTIIPGDEL